MELGTELELVLTADIGNVVIYRFGVLILRRYLGRKSLDELSRYGAERAREMGLDKLSEDEQMDYVNGLIKESRIENRNR